MNIARKNPRAEEDLVELAAYIALDKPSAAERFLIAAQDAVDKLAMMPGMGTRCEFADPRFADIRFWPIRRYTNYLILYRPCPDGIEVIRVLHGARDILAALREA